MSYQISDESIFDLSKVLYTQLLSEKNMKQLDKENLVEFKKKFIKPLYPHKEYTRNGQKIFQKYQCGQYCCEINPGRFCCCTSKPPDHAYRQFGLGICLYTKFIKHLSCFMFFVCILAAFSIAAYQIVTIQTGINATENYQTALYSTTVGTLSSQFLKCSYKKLVLNIPLQFKLQCPIGQVVPKGPVHTDKSLSSLINCRLQKQKQYVSNSIYTTLQYNSSPTYRDVNLTFTSNDNRGEQYISYNFECINSQLNISNNKIQLSKVIYFTVGIDLFIVVIFILFMISEHNAEQKQVQYFKSSQLAIHDFTVKISGFHVGDYQNQLDNFIFGYNQIVNGATNVNFIDNIVQIKVPQAEQLKKASQNRRDIYQQMYDHMYDCFFDDEVDILRYQNAEDFIKKCYGNKNSASYQEYKRILSNLVQKFIQSKRIKYLEGDIDVSILMVLANPKHKKQMIRRAKNHCFGNYIQIGNKKHQVTEPPVADLIIWENKYKFTFLRVIIAWIITLGIVLGSYLLIGFAQFKKQQLLSDSKFKVDCGILFTNNQLTNWSDSLSSSKPTQYLHCYCSANYFSLNTDLQMRRRCSDWFSKYITFMGIPILISFGIVIYNLIVSRLFRFLSRFQAHENITSELYSYIIKRSFVLILNMGLIIILLKMQYNTNINAADISFLFSGQFPDLSSDWYMQIGVIIILTLSFNIALPIFDMIFVSFLKCLRKCWDQKCCCVKTSQKTKKGYIQLYANDIFPIEQRYSDFIALLIICMTFSAVMPILYIIMFLSIWFMFISDKLLLFKIYQKPINFNQNLQNNVFKIFYISVMIHCVVSPFILSEKNLSSLANNITNLDRFQTLLKTPYLLPYVILFLLLAFWAVFYSTIVNALSYCIKKCQKQVSKVYKSKLHQNFFEALNHYQITKLMMSIQSQLHRNVQHQKSKKVSSHQIICQNTMRKLKEAEKAMAGNHKNEGNIRLIGKAGYEQIFDDETFYRQRKIKSLDYQFTEILRRENNIRNSSIIQETLINLK